MDKAFLPDTSNREFQDALNLVKYTRQSLFLTGKAGTGKSTFLRYVCDNVRKKHVVLAPTGIAAINAGGSTLHSFFKLPFHPLLPDDPNLSLQKGRIHEFFKYTKPHRKLLEELELVIIDEISMVRADIIDAVDRILRVYSHNLREPFGGKQLLLVGDVFQLEPVVKADERDILNRFYPTPYFFSARVFSQIELVSVELQKVYRQSDPQFIGMLDHIRNNTAGSADLQLLNTRYTTATEPADADDLYITLATRRDNVDYINERRLKELPGQPESFLGEVHGDFPESSLPTSQELVLKPGAQVIFIKNDYERRWVNGTIGVVSGFDLDGETLYITTDDGRACDVRRETWRNIRYTYNEEKKQIEEEELGTFTQFPVRLAWAITVHKSQGLTFSRVVIDFTGGVFAGGQTYVALSRCTSLEGIRLRKPVSRADVFVRPEIVQFAERFNNRQAIDRALKQAQADVQYAAATKAFDRGDFDTFLTEFFKAIHSRYDIERPAAQRLIRRKLNVINRLREENRALRTAALEKEKTLVKYAREYINMGDECLKHDMKEAALRNYEKAVALCPKFKEAWKKSRNWIRKCGKNKRKEGKNDYICVTIIAKSHATETLQQEQQPRRSATRSRPAERRRPHHLSYRHHVCHRMPRPEGTCHRTHLPSEGHRPQEEQPLHHLLRPEQHQRVCQGGQRHLQADETQPARPVYLHPKRHYTPTQNLPQPQGSRHPHARQPYYP